MNNKNVWILNTIACVFCLVAGVTCLINGRTVFGVLDVVLGTVNGVCAVLGFIGFRNR